MNPSSDSSLNGFTGFGQRRDPRFQSARDALRQSEQEIQGRAQAAAFPAGGHPGVSGPLEVTGLYRPVPYREPFGSWEQIKAYANSLRGDQSQGGFDPALLESLSGRDRRWSWTEINLDALAYNVRAMKALVEPFTRVMAVVKADAYGHGAVRCAQAALAAGAERCGVATVDEGIELRRGGITAPIQLLSEPPLSAVPLVVAYDLIPALYTTEFAIAYGEVAASVGRPAPYHLAVNSGMNRIGVRAEEVVAFLESVSFHSALVLQGTFTHFATADVENSLDFATQVRRFMLALAAMRDAGFDPGIVSAANSAATVLYPEVHFDMVRPGIILYGLHPCALTVERARVRPVMEVHARITDVRSVPMSEGVSYGMIYRSPGNVRICTLPIGYADGLHRLLSDRIDVLLGGRRWHQVGRICMDQCMFEVNHRDGGGRFRLEPAIGDEVVIVGRQGDEMITLDELAETAGTITHELAIALGTSRMTRLYR